MDTQPYDPGRKRFVSFSPLLLAVALSPVFLQTSTVSCKTGDTTLSELAVSVGGQNQITFVKTQRTYDVWLPLGTNSALVRAIPTDPKAQIWVDVYIGANRNRIMNGVVGGGQVTIPLQPDLNTLQVWVRPPGGASGTYNVAIRVGCSHCADGNVCTADTCNASLQTCAHAPVADGTSCDFGGLPGACIGGLCQDDPCASVACADGNECTADACDPTDGTCANDPVANGTSCDVDGLAGTCVIGTCDPSVFACTEQGLREAIARGGGPYRFACNGPTTVTTQAEIVIDNDVILDGEGNLTVDGNGSHRVFYMAAGVTAELIGFTMTGGSSDLGGGISNYGELTLTNNTVSGNTAEIGGFLYNHGTVTLTNSTVSGNTAQYNGGAIVNQAEVGTLTVTNSTVSGNRANDGGGIYNISGTVTLTNSTVSGNTAQYNGGGIDNSGALTVTNSTVSGNTAGLSGGSGGSISNNHGTVTLTNSLIDDDCYNVNVFGTITSGGGNLESPGNTCGFNQPTDQINVTAEDLKLGPLQDNGGPTMTHALLPGSVTIDRIPPAMCVDADGEPLTTDQRGVTRPQGPACDVGALERVPSWATPEPIEPVFGDYARALQVAVDPNGDALAVWASNNGVYHFASSYTRAAGWSSPEIVGESILPGGQMHVAMDFEGRGLVVWYKHAYQYNAIWSSRYTPESGWETPVFVGNSHGIPTPRVAFDSEGNALALWEGNDAANDDLRLWFNRYTPEAGWGTAEPVYADQLNTSSLSTLAMNPDGHAVALWGRNTVWASRYAPGTGWGEPERIGIDADRQINEIQVEMNASGGAMAVWRQGDPETGLRDIWSNHYTPDDGWGTPQMISDGFESRRPVLATDRDGNALALWDRWDGIDESIWSRPFAFSEGWGEAQPVETNDLLARFSDVGMNQEGDAIAVWIHVDPELPENSESIWSNRYTPGVGWGVPWLIRDHTGVYGAPQIAVAPRGTAVLVWADGLGGVANASIWANRFE